MTEDDMEKIPYVQFFLTGFQLRYVVSWLEDNKYPKLAHKLTLQWDKNRVYKAKHKLEVTELEYDVILRCVYYFRKMAIHWFPKGDGLEEFRRGIEE